MRQLLGLQFEDAAPGTLKIFRNPQEREAALRLADFLAPHGLSHQVLDRDALLKSEPSVANAATPISGALLFPDDRVGNARLFCARLAEHAIARGGEIRYATTAQQLLVKNGQLAGVRLAEEDLFGQVVICAGVGAPKLAAPLGVKLPIRPAKGYSITLKADELTAVQPVHPLADASLHIAVTPLGQHLRVLGMAEFIGMDRQLDPHRLTMLRQFFEQLLPDVGAQVDWQGAEKLVRSAANVIRWPTIHWPNANTRSVVKLRPWPFGLDQSGWFGALIGRPDCGPQAGNQSRALCL